MKNIKYMICIGLSLVLGLMYSCSKQQIVKPIGETVALTVNVIAPNDTLELLKDGKVFFQSKTTQNVTKITVGEGGTEIQIRKKGETAIMATRMIHPNAFQQTIEIIFEDGKIYEKFINLIITGFKASGILEVYIDGKLVPSNGTDENGNPTVPTDARVPVAPGQNRLVEVRKRGETAAIASQVIVPDQDKQEFKFYYDGEKNISTINVGPLSNPEHMVVIARFSSTVGVYTGPADFVLFKNVNGVVTNLNMKIELPEDGSFGKTIELPSLPPKGVYYGKIVKRGTINEPPYNTANEMLPIRPLYEIIITFTAGGAAIFSLKDNKVVRERPAALKGTTFSIVGNDIARYIKTITFK